jgi:general secretion pathway protein B
MPEIRITVLVFAQTPEDRFVLINGQRLKEKEEVAPGILIDEIRRDGVVFSYRKYRFLVKS